MVGASSLELIFQSLEVTKRSRDPLTTSTRFRVVYFTAEIVCHVFLCKMPMSANFNIFHVDSARKDKGHRSRMSDLTVNRGHLVNNEQCPTFFVKEPTFRLLVFRILLYEVP